MLQVAFPHRALAAARAAACSRLSWRRRCRALCPAAAYSAKSHAPRLLRARSRLCYCCRGNVLRRCISACITYTTDRPGCAARTRRWTQHVLSIAPHSVLAVMARQRRSCQWSVRLASATPRARPRTSRSGTLVCNRRTPADGRLAAHWQSCAFNGAVRGCWERSLELARATAQLHAEASLAAGVACVPATSPLRNYSARGPIRTTRGHLVPWVEAHTSAACASALDTAR